MKQIILLLAMAIIVLGCTNQSGDNAPNGKKQSMSLRDFSITKANAYNDLFLDSTQVQQFISQQQLQDDAATKMRIFYNARNYEFAWFGSKGLNEQALAFRNLYEYDDSSATKKTLDRSLDSLLAEDSLDITATDAGVVKTELMLSWRFINYLFGKYNTDDAWLALPRMVPAKKQDPLAMADSVLHEKTTELVKNDWYPALRRQLQNYVTISRQGGWTTIPAPKRKIKTGAADSLLVAIKKRLQLTGELTGTDTSALPTPALDTAIRIFQRQHGHKPDGILSATLINELNIPVLSRIEQLLVNMERMRWMPAIAQGKVILVNIPEFILHAKNNTGPSFDMRIVVGKEGHSTVMFSGDINQVVFSPYWNLPPGIVRKEVLPAMDKNSHYLEEHNMEITGHEDGLPVIRQLPGEKNELGKVKFLFPNSFNIYFHDTPHKELFQNDKRAFSHGCIRLSEPEKMAAYLLEDQQEWTTEKIKEAMNSGHEKFVRVKEPALVLIYYYTTWVNEQGQLQWRDDIYGHDDEARRKLFN